MAFDESKAAASGIRAKGLFLDRDGTLIANYPYLKDPANVTVLPGVRDTLIRALADGYLLFLLTNQSGVGRGYYTMEDVEACNRRMFELLNLPPPGFTGICVAPEAPDAPPVYRKPSPRYILEMTARHDLDRNETWMIGDSLTDVEAGLNAGVRAALLAAERPEGLPATAWHCSNLVNFHSMLMGLGRQSKTGAT